MSTDACIFILSALLILISSPLAISGAVLCSAINRVQAQQATMERAVEITIGIEIAIKI